MLVTTIDVCVGMWTSFSSWAAQQEVSDGYAGKFWVS
jgi:hypothetical protein